MENNEIINRIKLMMIYDSKKTLTENRNLLNEETHEEIYNQIKKGNIHGLGTNEGELEKAIRMIQRTVKSWPEFEALDSFLMKKTGDYSTKRNLQQILNGEFESDDLDTVKIIADLLNQTPGVKCTFKTIENFFTTNSIVISQKSGGEDTSTKGNAGIKVNAGIKGNAGINWTTAPTIEEAKTGKYIKYGMSGDSVVEIQTKLNEKGGYKLETKTKKFGTNTKNALIVFQKKNNITPAQGVFGPKTWRVLFAQPNADVETSNQQKQEKPILQNPLNTPKGFSDYKLNNTSQPTA